MFGAGVMLWCFEHLSRPAYHVSWEIFKGNRHVTCPMIWKRWTQRLRNAPWGTKVTTPEGKVMIYMTVAFRSDEDATLFALKWGSVPFEKNEDVASISYLLK